MATDPQLPNVGFWTELLTAVAGVSALGVALFRRRGVKFAIAKLSKELAEHVLQDEKRLTALETLATENKARLGRIEDGISALLARKH